MTSILILNNIWRKLFKVGLYIYYNNKKFYVSKEDNITTEENAAAYRNLAEPSPTH